MKSKSIESKGNLTKKICSGTGQGQEKDLNKKSIEAG